MKNEQLFVNLLVKDVQRSMQFFQHLGYTFNPQFTNEVAACMIINEPSIFAMLLSESHMSQFTSRPLANAKETCQVLLALSCSSKAEVDDLMTKVNEAGGKEHRDPQDHGWMYSRAFEDLDGNIWELGYMDINAFPSN